MDCEGCYGVRRRMEAIEGETHLVRIVIIEKKS
jgi:hypothetical protein